MNTRRFLLLVGVVTVAAGVVAIVIPGVVSFPVGRAVVVGIGLLALGQAVRVIQQRRDGRLDMAMTPDPEHAVSTPQPGEDLGSVLAPFLNRRRVSVHVNRVRDGLRAVAVAVLTQFEGVAEAEAKERVAMGTWTEDTVAGSFLGESDASRPPVWTRLRNRFTRTSSYQRAIRRTVDAIEAVVDQYVGVNDGVPSSAQDQAVDARSRGETGPDRGVSTADTVSLDGESGAVVSRNAHSTGRWRGVSVVALIGIGVGVIVEQPAVLLGGVVGIGYAAYARSPALPPGQVSIDREVSTETPAMGEVVTVTVTVTNTGPRLLPDIRVVDGVPEALAVESGSPRCGTALRPMASTSFSYTVTARRGAHEFGPTQVISRNITGETEEERLYTSETTLTCIPSLSAGTEPVPLRRKATRFVGREPTSTTGDGVEFSATREYRPGDPMRRIDWNRRARTRELTTIEFREERAATVVLLIDARAAAYISPTAADGHAVDRAVDAARHLFTQLCESGNRVGVAVAGTASCWLAPDTGVEHRDQARELLAVAPALSPVPDENQTQAWDWQSTLRKRLQPGTQIVFLSPLCDDGAKQIARQFDERGFPVTVVSPDPTTQVSPSHKLGRIARQLHVADLRGAGIPVVDWAWSEPLDAAVARYNERRQK